MRIKFSNNFLNKLALIIIPILILFWLISSLLFINRVSFSVLTYQTQNVTSSNNAITLLYKDQAYKGEFISKDNNLGMIILKLDNYKKPKFGAEDILVFKFKEKGKSNWDYTMEYASSLFDSQSYFPFGIPIIPDSKNKHYEFEFLSTKGDSNNHIKLKTPLTFITGYQYSKPEILGGSLKTVEFIYNKVLGFITDLDLVLKSLIYLAPLIIFLIIYTLLKHLFLKIKYITIPFNNKYIKILVLLILIKLLLPKDTSIDSFFILLVIWIGAVIIFKLKSDISFFLSLSLLLIWVLIIPLGLQNLQNKLNVLVYALFTFGSLQLLYEEKKSEGKEDEKKKI